MELVMQDQKYLVQHCLIEVHVLCVVRGSIRTRMISPVVKVTVVLDLILPLIKPPVPFVALDDIKIRMINPIAKMTVVLDLTLLPIKLRVPAAVRASIRTRMISPVVKVTVVLDLILPLIKPPVPFVALDDIKIRMINPIVKIVRRDSLWTKRMAKVVKHAVLGHIRINYVKLFVRMIAQLALIFFQIEHSIRFVPKESFRMKRIKTVAKLVVLERIPTKLDKLFVKTTVLLVPILFRIKQSIRFVQRGNLRIKRTKIAVKLAVLQRLVTKHVLD